MRENDVMSEKPGTNREWKLIENLLHAQVKEQRRTRRWGIFFKLLIVAYLFVLMYFVFVAPSSDHGVGGRQGPHTGLVEVFGIIAPNEEANADAIVTGLRRAFEDNNSKGVILRINSPGGSPVQSGYIYDEIVRLRALHPDKKVYAVVADIGASGAYYIAAAADEIYADKASLVGSIGVTASGFGFVDMIEKLGIERRTFTAGAHKSFLDPFKPVNEKEREIWEEVLQTTHQQFISQVEKGRGDRLKQEDPLLYSGVVWSGEQALDLGLVDALGSSGFVAREVIGAEDIVDYTVRPSPFEELVAELGVSFGKGLGQSVMGAGMPVLR